jgi:hypothetical protein
MRPEDVPAEWVETTIVALSNWGRIADGVPIITSSAETCFAEEFCLRVRHALAAVIPLIQSAERDRAARVAEHFGAIKHGSLATEPLAVQQQASREISAAIRALDDHPRAAAGVVPHETGNVRDKGEAPDERSGYPVSENGMEAAIAAYEAAMWLPIDAAPVEVEGLVWVADGGHLQPSGKRAGRLAFGRVSVYVDLPPKAYASGYNGDWHITHWRPLPAKPGEDA